MFLKEALKKSEIVRHKDKQSVSREYLEHFFSAENPYMVSEYEEVYGYYVELSFDELISDKWEPV